MSMPYANALACNIPGSTQVSTDRSNFLSVDLCCLNTMLTTLKIIVGFQASGILLWYTSMLYLMLFTQQTRTCAHLHVCNCSAVVHKHCSHIKTLIANGVATAVRGGCSGLNMEYYKVGIAQYALVYS